MWDAESARHFCTLLEQIAPQFGAHVALTGGCLYKTGLRKDVDVIFYRIRQQPFIDWEGLWTALGTIGVSRGSTFGWVTKATFEGKQVDIFDSENRDALEHNS